MEFLDFVDLNNVYIVRVVPHLIRPTVMVLPSLGNSQIEATEQNFIVENTCYTLSSSPTN